jgi:ribose transport system ATP-binding protein
MIKRTWRELRLSESAPVLSLEGIAKRFPGVLALDGIRLTLYPGEVHALIGENGSGKSTLAKIISGVHQPDEGTIYHLGRQVQIKSPRHAQELGISTIYQDFMLVKDISVMENIFLGREPVKKGFAGLVVDRERMHKEASALLDSLTARLEPGLRVADLGVAQKQIVEIAKALSLSGEAILVMDEPTSALSAQEVDELFRMIRQSKSRGISILYITHRLEEVKVIADRVTVLRDGKLVGTVAVRDAHVDMLIQMMVGRSLTDLFPKHPSSFGDHALEIKNLTVLGKLHDISFAVREGEILGVFGLVGAGRTELARALIGKEPIHRGAIYLRGQRFIPRSVGQAISSGLGMVPEERRAQGILPLMTVAHNITLAALDRCMRGPLIDRSAIRQAAMRYIDSLRIRTPSPDAEIFKLSGGNQQKVVLARFLFADARILLLDEPTRGIDVGAKREVYQIISELAASGRAILMISSELPEILGMCDRALVMSRGHLVAEFDRSEMTGEGVMRAALNVRSA